MQSPTLADLIASARGTAVDKRSKGGLSTLSKDIGGANRFVVSDDVFFAAEDVVYTKPSSMIAAMKFARPPFDRTWIEWGQTAYNAPPTAFNPLRCGALIECVADHPDVFLISTAWLTDPKDIPRRTDNPNRIPARAYERAFGPAIDISAYSAIVDMSENELTRTHPDFENVGIRNQRVEGAAWGGYKNTPFEHEAIQKFFQRIIFVDSPYGHALAEKLLNSSEEVRQAAGCDLTGDIPVILGLLCLLSAKNCIVQSKADLMSINKRRRLLNEKPMLEHINVDIDIGRRARNAAADSTESDPKSQLRRHLVRGHFKVRRSGIYWWRPFPRGNPELGEVVHDKYNVRLSNVQEAKSLD